MAVLVQWLRRNAAVSNSGGTYALTQLNGAGATLLRTATTSVTSTPGADGFTAGKEANTEQQRLAKAAPRGQNETRTRPGQMAVSGAGRGRVRREGASGLTGRVQSATTMSEMRDGRKPRPHRPAEGQFESATRAAALGPMRRARSAGRREEGGGATAAKMGSANVGSDGHALRRPRPERGGGFARHRGGGGGGADGSAAGGGGGGAGRSMRSSSRWPMSGAGGREDRAAAARRAAAEEAAKASAAMKTSNMEARRKLKRVVKASGDGELKMSEADVVSAADLFQSQLTSRARAERGRRKLGAVAPRPGGRRPRMSLRGRKERTVAIEDTLLGQMMMGDGAGRRNDENDRLSSILADETMGLMGVLHPGGTPSMVPSSSSSSRASIGRESGGEILDEAKESLMAELDIQTEEEWQEVKAAAIARHQAELANPISPFAHVPRPTNVSDEELAAAAAEAPEALREHALRMSAVLQANPAWDGDSKRLYFETLNAAFANSDGRGGKSG